MSEIIYKKASRDDIASLVRLRLEYFETDAYEDFTAEEKARLKPELERYFSKHIEDDCAAFIAYDKDEAVSCVLMLFYEKPANRSCTNGRFAEILGVYTKPAYRKLGLASKLMQMALDAGAEDGVSYIELGASKMGENMYRRLGFEESPSEYLDMRYSFTKNRLIIL